VLSKVEMVGSVSIF